jgi:hypothetical protein
MDDIKVSQILVTQILLHLELFYQIPVKTKSIPGG